MKSKNSYTLQPFTLERKLVEDANRIGQKFPFIHGLLEADVTDVRKELKVLRRKNKAALSLTAYLLHCFTVTIDECKAVHGCKSWNNKIYVFDDVDVFFPIELADRNLKPQMLRSANKKNPFALEQEIAAAKAKPKIAFDAKQRFFFRLPRFVRDFCYNYWMKRPLARKQFFGTAYFSCIGIFPLGLGWGIPVPMHSIGMFVGTIENKVVMRKEELLQREFLSITITVDHSVVDGGVQARFMVRLRENILKLVHTL